MEIFAPQETPKGLYRLSGKHPSVEPAVHTVYPTSPATLWHQRLGHFNTKGLQRMKNFEAVKGLPPLHFSSHVCSSCQLGKHARTKMPKSTSHQAFKILELVHSDVCRPFKVNSLGGHRYFVTFIDDYSRKTWVYFLSHKSQVLSKFQHFVQLMRTTTGKQNIKILRFDNGGEYTSKAFSDYCSLQGICHELVPPYTPERNGVAERRNRSLLDITRCVLLNRNLPAHLWGEAVKAAADLLNMRSTNKHPDKTPNEFFCSKKPSVSHLRIFGSLVFAHIPKPSRSKLEPRSEQCILLSFDESARAYRCYRPSTRKVFLFRDVVIDETTSTLPPPSQDQAVAPTDISAPTTTEELRSSSSSTPAGSTVQSQQAPEEPISDTPDPPTPSTPLTQEPHHHFNDTQVVSPVPATSTTPPSLSSTLVPATTGSQSISTAPFPRRFDRC